MRYAIVVKGKVTNVVEYDGKSRYKPDEGKLVKVDTLPVGIDWTYEGGKFVEPVQKPKS